MISSSWGAPAAFTKGFNLQDVSDGLYGRHLHVYSWPEGELKQTLDLGSTGMLPLEVSMAYHHIPIWLFHLHVVLTGCTKNYTPSIQ